MNSEKLAQELAASILPAFQSVFLVVLQHQSQELEARQVKQSTSEVEYLTVEETAALLKVSPAHIKNLIYRGEIPFHKVGTVYRFLKSEILSWTKQAVDPAKTASKPRASSKLKAV